ncbi:hypothetical protein [Aeromonas media]|uniref:hypothetical protein n=1 Tax=Aeromonas media TaxID=651 RepID=UPI0011178626|nr:hypothetical protein [Aeromonas media]
MMQFGKCLVLAGSSSVQLGGVTDRMLLNCFKTLKCDLVAISSSHVFVPAGGLYASLVQPALCGEMACPRADRGEIKEACGREATLPGGKWRLA